MESKDNKPQKTYPNFPNDPMDSHEDVQPDLPESDIEKKGLKIGKFTKFKNWYISKKKLSIPASLLLIALLLAIVPFSRYALGGVLIKKDLNVLVKDAKTGRPVSGANVSLGSISGTTNASGVATLPHVRVGYHEVSIAKTYYKSTSAKVIAPILKQNTMPPVAFTATGRQVGISVKNIISGQAVVGAKITVDKSVSQTDAQGKALIVVPEGLDSKDVTISAKDFNDKDTKVVVSDNEIKDNLVSLVPAGHVYFLSKQSGKLDVMRANLDGSDPKTVLAGTGKEDEQNTRLLPSSDWSYLALLSSRDGPAKVFVINTADDSLINVDNGDAEFSAAGWLGHYFIYKLARHNYQSWQANALSIKSFNAENGKILTLANNGASGSNNADAEHEDFKQMQLIGNEIMFTRTWYKNSTTNVEGRQNSLAAIHADGSGSRTIKSLDATTGYIGSIRLNKPHELQFVIYDQTNNSPTVYILDKNGTVTQAPSAESVNDALISYFQEPSTESTFWQEPRGSKNALFLGDQDGGNPKLLAANSDFSAFGWYTKNYLLLSKNSSELYIIPATGSGSTESALKITDYFR